MGNVEFERDQLCNLTFKPEAARGGSKLEFDPVCGESIPPLKEVEAWILTNDGLRLIDGRGRTVFEFSEVEVGMYEGERKGEGLYFLQTAKSAAAFGTKRSADEMAGEWAMVRSEKPVCSLNLTKTATKGFDEFRLTIRPPCDPTLTRLNPNVWRMDRGELVLASPNGQAWRFEERNRSGGGVSLKAQIRSCCRRNSCKPAQISLKGCRLGSVRQRPGVMPVTRLKARLKAASNS